MKKDKKIDYAKQEYERLIKIYKEEAKVDLIKLNAYDSLIKKVSELYAILESIKDLPSIIYDKKNPSVQKETAVGKARVKYMAQYVSATQKLNRELLGSLTSDDEDEDLEEYE